MSREFKHTPGRLTVHSRGDRQFWITSDFMSAPSKAFEDAYFEVSGYFGSYGPHMFSAAPDLVKALEALRSQKLPASAHRVISEALAAAGAGEKLP